MRLYRTSVGLVMHGAKLDIYLSHDRYETVTTEKEALQLAYHELGRMLGCSQHNIAILQSATAAWMQVHAIVASWSLHQIPVHAGMIGYWEHRRRLKSIFFITRIAHAGLLWHTLQGW